MVQCFRTSVMQRTPHTPTAKVFATAAFATNLAYWLQHMLLVRGPTARRYQTLCRNKYTRKQSVMSKRGREDRSQDHDQCCGIWHCCLRNSKGTRPAPNVALKRLCSRKPDCSRSISATQVPCATLVTSNRQACTYLPKVCPFAFTAVLVRQPCVV